jgi:hypothetical protein
MLLFVSLMIATLTGVRWNLNVLSMCIYLLTNNIEHLICIFRHLYLGVLIFVLGVYWDIYKSSCNIS